MCISGPCVAPSFRARPTGLGFDALTLADDVHVLRARSTYWPAPGNIVVVADPDGVALIDCGFGTEEALDGVADALIELGYGIEAIHTVLITHPHLDHAGGLALLPSHVEVVGPPRVGSLVADAWAAAELIFPSSVRDLAPERADLDIVEHFRTDCGIAPAQVQSRPLEPGENVRLGGTSWVAVPTPGHASQMFCYFEPELKVLVSSDAIVARGTSIPWYAPNGGGTGAYLNGLETLLTLGATTAVRGHGDILRGAEAVDHAIQDTASRIERRTQVLPQVLGQRPRTFAQLEEEIYPERVYEVIPWASSVLATHLYEAIEDGSVCRDGDRFVAVETEKVR